MKVLFWRSLVVLFVILGFIGAILPGMPTTVFLILAAWASSKGWPQMDDWLLNHPKYGPTLRDWRAHGTVPRKAKWLASIMMLISGIIMLFTTAPLAVKAFTNITMLIVAIWLWRRPEPNQIIIQQNTVDPEKTDLPTAPSEHNQLNPIKPNKIESENNKS
ncbi:YbaN family protein [Acinetobacter sp. RG5]|nr:MULTISPECIES: YbaN family protein [unclassified Acinetobacter]MDT0198181.1 YbaN family protein [Acinetobacter sp. RG5]MDT0229645.1 YbaN family protein [Acinetobacter sp. RRD8]